MKISKKILRGCGKQMPLLERFHLRRDQTPLLDDASPREPLLAPPQSVGV